MIKYIKWTCLIISIIGIFILSYLFIKRNFQKETLEKDFFEITSIQNIAWYKTKIEMYKNNTLINRINLLDPEHIIFQENKIEYNDPLTNQINTYSYEYKNSNLIIYEAKSFLLSGTYNIKLQNEELILTQKENDIINIYYFTKAAG